MLASYKGRAEIHIINGKQLVFSRMLYFVQMFLLLQVPAVARLFSDSEAEKVVIRRMALFCILYYGPHFLNSTSASRYN